MLQTSSTADQINSVIDHLADKLSVPAGHLWTILVRQSYVSGWMHVLSAFAELCVLAGIVWGVRFCYKQYTHERDTQKKDFADLCQPGTAWMIGVIGLSIATLVIGGGILGHASDAIGQFTNPQYYAIQSILSALK